MTKHEEERLQRLENRRDYLKEKIAALPRTSNGLAYARAELSSLRHFIPVIRRYIELSDEERMQFWGTNQEYPLDALPEA